MKRKKELHREILTMMDKGATETRSSWRRGYKIDNKIVAISNNDVDNRFYIIECHT
jgi:hypothetical protein